MTGNRMSSLPIAEYCGRAGQLQNGSGRAAAMGTAFHAYCHTGTLPDGLTEDERAEVLTWHKPADVGVGGGTYLRYQDATTEPEVTLTEGGEVISVGHIDMVWTYQQQARKICYVGDIKRSAFTSADGPRSLQLIAYGFAWATAHDCDAFACGIWDATGGEWSWGDMIAMDSEDAIRLWERVVHAAKNVGGEYCTGPHCGSCWQRWKCPAHLLPPDMAETTLAPFTAAGSITQDNAYQLRQIADRASDTVELVDKLLKEWAKTHGGIDGPDGKKWLPVQTKGRESFDKARALADHPELSSYMKRGAPYDVFRWVKASK